VKKKAPAGKFRELALAAAATAAKLEAAQLAALMQCRLRESLQESILQRRAWDEELQTANEEIRSSYEELQRINDELEMAREELQASNEALITLNESLEDRNAELKTAKDDLLNLLTNVNLAIVIVDNDFKICRFTPVAERVFNLIPSDVGRPLSDLKHSIVVIDLDQLIRQTIDNLSFIDREVRDTAGHSYSLRIRPYRTKENKISGAVLILVDLDQQKPGLQESSFRSTDPFAAMPLHSSAPSDHAR